jgi:hypothetical protein
MAAHNIYTTNDQQLAWRRDKVLDMLIKGNSQRAISRELKLDEGTISRDVQHLRQRAKDDMKQYVEELLPLEFQKAQDSINELKTMAWRVLAKPEADQDLRLRLQTIVVLKDLTLAGMQMLDDGVVVRDSVIRRAKGELNDISTESKEAESRSTAAANRQRLF